VVDVSARGLAYNLYSLRIIRYEIGSGAHLGLEKDAHLFPIAPDPAGALLPELLGKGKQALADAVGEALSRESQPAASARLLAPLLRPPKVIAIGLNYEGHRLETKADPPTEPTVFSKFATAIIGPHDDVCLPRVAPRRVDYEAELAVVLGATGRDVEEGEALSWVAGYTVANDVSARDWQTRKPNGQWLLGKSFDTFLPLGPAVVTADEIPDPGHLQVTCAVSGEILQAANTSELIFGVPALIAYLSQVFTLEAGDVILTGTPAGVGMARNPPRWLAPGDVIETTVEGIGTLRNRVVGE
jgi:2-keto-4-pentenoate hydratase/2-oxohepta-3-ene-1,7-dioic acid hydratase in catechol pathway